MVWSGVLEITQSHWHLWKEEPTNEPNAFAARDPHGPADIRERAPYSTQKLC